jgi:hypothetical protein
MSRSSSFVDRLPARRRQALDSLVVATLAITISLAVARLPQNMPSGGLDSSWGTVLQHAHDHELSFGSDVVFTYGPLGHAATGAFSGGTHLFSAWAGMAITFLFVLPLVLVARRLPWRRGTGMLLLVGALPMMRACGLDGFVQAALCCWGLLAFTADARTPRPATILAGACLGLSLFVALIGLTKFSWLVAGAATVAAVAADLALRGHPLPAAALATATGGLWLGGWVALGQPLSHVPAFMAGSLEIASGYARSMGTRGPTGMFVLALVSVASCAAGIVIRGRAATLPGDGRTAARRWLLGLWLLGMLFIGWKHGMTRAAEGDSHITALMCQCVVVAFALPLIPVSPSDVDRLASSRGWGLAILAIVIGHWMHLGSLEDGTAQALRRISTNARVLIRPGRHHRWLDDAWGRAREPLALPTARGLIGDAPVDVFGYSQDYAIANGLNYSPRPVIQSYSVYTRRLAELNDHFYHSPRAPGWVLFELGSIDGRLPSLEDSHALRTILHDYRPVGTDNRFLVLHRRREEPVVLEPLAGGTARIGERIDLAAYGPQDLWLEIDTSPGVLARLETFVLRPPPLRIRVWCEGWPAEGVVFNAPAPMLAAGFIASPVLGGTDDVAALLKGEPPRRMQSFALETSWRARDIGIRYRLSCIVGGLAGDTAPAE